jgi:hypothetical protein
VKQVIAIGCIVCSFLVLFHPNLSFNSSSVRTIAVPAPPAGPNIRGCRRRRRLSLDGNLAGQPWNGYSLGGERIRVQLAVLLV